MAMYASGRMLDAEAEKRAREASDDVTRYKLDPKVLAKRLRDKKAKTRRAAKVKA